MAEDSTSSKCISYDTSCDESNSGGKCSETYHQLHEDHKWAHYLSEDTEEGMTKTSIETRMKVIEDSEDKLRKEAYERGITAWKTAKIPYVERQRKLTENEMVPKTLITMKKGHSKIRENEVKGNTSLEINENTLKEELLSDSNKLNNQIKQEDDAKYWREHQPLQYFWKPDPLFYLHLTQLGYSKIAVEKALYYTDNKSVDLAEKYIQEHPNITPLTKEEVMADAEAFLRGIKPSNSGDEASGGNEITIDLNAQLGTELRNFQEGKTQYSEGKEVSLPQQRKKMKKNEKVELLCVINAKIALDVTTLAVECSRATVKIVEELQKDKWRKLYEDWMKDGKLVNAYQTNDAFDFYQLQKRLLQDGHLNHLAEKQNPHSPDSVLPTVLCFFSTAHVKKIIPSCLKLVEDSSS